MEQIIRLILLISAVCSLCASQHQYVFIQTNKTWHKAQRYCREKHFDLATIDSMSEMETVLKTVDGKYNDAVWIGLRKGTTFSWHWSLADDGFYKEGEKTYDYESWGSYLLNTPSNCATYRGGGGVQFLNICPNQHYAVCFDAEKQGSNQYVLTPTKLNWTNAQNYCRTHHTDLTSRRNDAEDQEINVLINATGKNVWIGLFRDPWKWSDKTQSSMRYWKLDQPVWTGNAKDCVAMLKAKSGKWGDRPCSERHPFICTRRTEVKVIKVKLSLNNSEDVDLNDPSVQESLLEQMKQQLGKTLPNDFKLRWKKQPNGKVFIKEKKTKKEEQCPRR